MATINLLTASLLTLAPLVLAKGEGKGSSSKGGSAPVVGSVWDPHHPALAGIIIGIMFGVIILVFGIALVIDFCVTVLPNLYRRNGRVGHQAGDAAAGSTHSSSTDSAEAV
ncbi:hypothetical protein B0H63DRAFT_523643 [Podospora didyma]|uniref:Uncharacterized protein n=1 Tax=Podospora didyma TaxID=330526 RepID=A0AAE0TV63_9PEZI|nr:hypothetical protein B0H63DRAFT_523643 [Podospora didyma]